uniref:Uncharacterized protein n=1 Tax=Siphoviridae sp. ctss15 TaxID=2825699 RepID=A0A8S5TRD4_9CAUD|nr:MAG TPA: hypothetical protein [Siphoviridae sp. ctss15]
MLYNGVKNDTIKEQIMRKGNKSNKNDQNCLESLRKQILEMIDQLTPADCAEIFSKLKERSVL